MREQLDCNSNGKRCGPSRCTKIPFKKCPSATCLAIITGMIIIILIMLIIISVNYIIIPVIV